MPAIHQYGCSVSLGEEASTCYGKIAAQHYGYNFVQHSASSASNPWIALHFCETQHQIQSDDVVLFGWSHPNRNSWYNSHTGRWEHLNFIQQKKRGSALTSSVVDYVNNQLSAYIEDVHDWYPKSIVENVCKLQGIKYMHVDCVPHMIDVLMQDRAKYIADHLHPNDAGHERIFQLIKNDLDAIINT